jgi:hypothetical protein
MLEMINRLREQYEARQKGVKKYQNAGTVDTDIDPTDWRQSLSPGNLDKLVKLVTLDNTQAPPKPQVTWEEYMKQTGQNLPEDYQEGMKPGTPTIQPIVPTLNFPTTTTTTNDVSMGLTIGNTTYRPSENPLKDKLTPTGSAVVDAMSTPQKPLTEEELKKKQEEEELKRKQEDFKKAKALLNIFSPTNTQSNLFNLGRGLGLKAGTKGKGLLIAGSAGASILGGARQALSGYGYSQLNQGAKDYANEMMARRQYEQAGSNDQNTTGGTSFAKNGGYIFQDGGESFDQGYGNNLPSPEDQEMLRRQEEALIPHAEEGGEEMDELTKTAQGLVEQIGSEEEIGQYLQERGVDEDTYNMLMEKVSELMSEEEGDDNEEDEEEELPEAKKGGKFKYKVGDVIEFKGANGKKVKGKISKIKNGKIYL